MPLTRARVTATSDAPAPTVADDVSAVAVALTDDDPMQRRDAARCAAALPAVAPFLADRLLVEPDGAVRDVILVSLATLGTPDALQGLARGLRSPEPAVRSGALFALPRATGDLAPVIADLLADGDPVLRGFAIDLARAVHHPQAAAWAQRVVMQDASPDVCAAAAELLGDLGTSDALSSLEALPARFPREPFVAFAAASARAKLSAP